jgi:hypothetical protein
LPCHRTRHAGHAKPAHQTLAPHGSSIERTLRYRSTQKPQGPDHRPHPIRALGEPRSCLLFRHPNADTARQRASTAPCGGSPHRAQHVRRPRCGGRPPTRPRPARSGTQPRHLARLRLPGNARSLSLRTALSETSLPVIASPILWISARLLTKLLLHRAVPPPVLAHAIRAPVLPPFLFAV